MTGHGDGGARREEPPDIPVLGAGADGEVALGGPSTRKRLFEALGGRDGVEKLVDCFYDRVEQDAVLRPIFPASTAVGRARQKLFLEEWLGGEPRYSKTHGPWRLRARHAPFRVTPAAAERWVEQMEASLLESGAGKELATEIASLIRPVAYRMVNSP